MMKSNLFALFSFLLLGVAGVMAQNATVVLNGFTTITTESATLQKTVSSVTVINAFKLGPAILKSFNTIIFSIGTVVTAISVPNPKPFSDAVAVQIVALLVKFVQVHQALLAVVIGKQSIFAQFFLTAPIAAVLRGLESIVDKFAFLLIGLIPTQKGEAMMQFGSLSITITKAITVYS